MANFTPLKLHMFYCLDRIIKTHNLTDPFLDAGCGIGDLSCFLAKKGWRGHAFDNSEVAIKNAKFRLTKYPDVTTSLNNISNISEEYQTIFLWDVLEHIDDDINTLKFLSSHLVFC